MGDQREPVACVLCDEVVEDCVCAEIVKAVEVVADNRGTIRAALLRRAHPPETEALVDALRGLNRNRHGDVLCFCDMAIGNPMVTRHSAACDRARRALEAYEGDR